LHTGRHIKVFFFLFLSAFSIPTFYIMLSPNGLVLGNDPSVHLSKAMEIVNSGKVLLTETSWYPPLYRVLLAELLIITGALNFEYAILLMKLLTVTFDWLLIFSVYIFAKKLFNENVGIIASSLLLLCFPLYEINFWGGYPSLLSIVYMYLLFPVISTRRESLSDKIVAFLMAFSLVLTHHFATFLATSILLVYMLVAIIIWRRSLKLTFILTVLGVIVAFLLWYLPIILPYINIFVSHVFFGGKTYLNLTWRVSLDVFIMSFGFIIVFAFLGLLLTFHKSKKEGRLEFYTLTCLSLIVPLLLSQSYLFGILLPYDRFVYYLMPPAVVFAAAVTYLVLRYVASYVLNLDWSLPEWRVKAKAVLLIFLAILLFASRFPVLTGKVYEATDYYSYLDPQSYNSAVWLKEAFPYEAKVAVSEKPGLFFGIVSQKSTVMELNPIVQRAANVEVMLNLAYELEHPLTLFRVYEDPMPYELEQYNVLIHGVWCRVAFLFDEETSICYSKDGKIFSVKISNLKREIFWSEEDDFKKLNLLYLNSGEFAAMESVTVINNRVPLRINWTFTPLNDQIKFLHFNLSIHFDLFRSFEKAYIPGMLSWETPWKSPSFIEVNRKWALVDFYPENLMENYIAVHDPKNNIFFAIKFETYPVWGSLGVLSTNQIDALRLKYWLGNSSRKVSISYLLAAFSEESFPVNLNIFTAAFTTEVRDFTVSCRDYRTCAMEGDIQFLVFDREKFRKEFLNHDFLELVYSNDRYVICKIKR